MNNLCVLPFNSISVDAKGILRPCCSSGQHFYQNVKDLSPTEILNNSDSISLRKEFIENKKSKFCNRCWEIEAIGSDSFRNVANNGSYGLSNNRIIQIKPEIDFLGIQFLDITLGNKCNLACRMCHPNSSSLVAKQWEALGKSMSDNSMIEFDRSTKNKFIEIIDKAINLDTIYMLGGEPLVSDFHNEILEHLVASGRSKDITIKYNTNLNVDISKYLEIWNQFKLIDLGISIDGSHETYEYIRWPGKWKKLWENLLTVSQYQNPIRPTIATTVQNLNIDNLYTLITEVLSNTDLNFYFIPITGENQLHYAPEEILEKALSDIETLPDTLFRKDDLINMIKSALEKSKVIHLNEQQIQEFFKLQKSYDNLRNQNLFKTKPHFLELANRFNIPIW